MDGERILAEFLRQAQGVEDVQTFRKKLGELSAANPLHGVSGLMFSFDPAPVDNPAQEYRLSQARTLIAKASAQGVSDD